MGWIAAIAFALISAILAARLLSLKRQLRNMAGQIKTLVDDNSEKMLDISLYDQDLERLAGAFNRYHAKQRGVVAQSLRHEDQLKESISNISHDLRTPLTVIMGHLQLLEKVDLPDNQKWRVEVSLRKSQRMAALVEAFYELSVLDSEQIIPHKERLNFSNLLFDLLAENASLLESRGIHPKIHMPDTTVFIRPLAKLGKAVKIADASNQGKAKGETVSAVSIGFREDTKPFDKADGVFNKDTFFRNLAVIFALLLGQWMIFGTLFRQKSIGVYQGKTLVSSIRLQHRFCFDMDTRILE